MSGQIFAFVPVIENDQGENVFLPTDPWVAVKSSELADVPLLSGITTDEGAIFGVGNLAFFRMTLFYHSWLYLSKLNKL